MLLTLSGHLSKTVNLSELKITIQKHHAILLDKLLLNLYAWTAQNRNTSVINTSE